MRSTPELQPLLSSCANYAIWDDHDFGPNDANGNFPLKDLTLEAFKMFWANPSYGLPGCDGEGVTSQFQWGDIDFFMLDNRYHRVAAGIVGQQATILGENQINWLIQSLADSKAPFKMVVVGGQFLNPLDKFEVFNTVPEERQKILDAIEKNNIKGVIFLTGDRHSAELSELTLNNGEKVYDLTVSPLTSRPYDTSKEPNTLRVAGTQAAVRNFGTLDFSGKRGSRNLHITVRDSNGKMLWEKDIAEKVKP
jgi:alkaline phosphatase D